MSLDVEELAAALRNGLAGESEPGDLADSLHRRLAAMLADDETTPRPPAEVVITSSPVFQWRMLVHRAPSGLIESVDLAPVSRVEIPQ